MTAFDRSHPFSGTLVERRLLTGPLSARPTLHVVFSIAGAGFDYRPGDVVALIAPNPAELVERVLARLGLSGDEPVTLSSYFTLDHAPGPPPFVITLPVRRALAERLSLGCPTLRLLRSAIDRISDDDEAGAIEDLCEDDAALDAYLLERDLLDFLDEHPGVSFSAHELAGLLQALQPRTYSIASSPLQSKDEVHLTVGVVRWNRDGRDRIGVASAQLERMAIGDTMPLYWQPTRHFAMPESESTPMILVGPGTGVAPFLGFLAHRAHTRGAPSWLFFGAQTVAADHYYASELDRHREAGTLARLDLAFSRDGERIYVQLRMREAGDELFMWLERGAYLYVCGDAQKMAPDVERTVAEIVTARGRDGDAYLADLRATKRYRRDVY